jgi:hypothetical protein
MSKRPFAVNAVLTLGILTVLGSVAHGLAGGRALLEALGEAPLDPGLRQTILIGWHFGSLGMAVMGLLTILSSFALGPGSRHAFWSALLIGFALALFGLACSLLSFPNTHFLFFFALGLVQCLCVGSLRNEVFRAP